MVFRRTLSLIAVAVALTLSGILMNLPTGPSVAEARPRSNNRYYSVGYWDGYAGRDPQSKPYWSFYEEQMYRNGYSDGERDKRNEKR